MLGMLTTGLVAQAQIAIGVKAGASSSKVDIQDPKGSFENLKEKDAVTGYHAGAFLRLKALGLILQPEAVFTSSGGKVEVDNSGTGPTVKTTEEFKFNRLDVPLLLGYSLFNVARIQAGPVASVLINGKLADQNLEDNLNKTDWGWQAGLGFDIGNITADLRYERVKREYTNNANSFEVGNQQVIFSLGFKIIGK